MEEFKGIFSDEKHKNYCTTAPPSGRLKKLAQLRPHDAIFTRHDIYACDIYVF